MTLSPRWRRTWLTVHIACSVGWLGAVGVFLLLALTGLASTDPPRVTAVYLTLPLVIWGCIVPLSLAATLSGILQSLVTGWGLLRHYWVVIKLGLTVPATMVLLVHTRPVAAVATAASEEPFGAGAALGHALPDRLQLVVAASAAALVLITVMTLGVVKPRGLTRYGQRRAEQRRSVRRPAQQQAARTHTNSAAPGGDRSPSITPSSNPTSVEAIPGSAT